MCYCGQVSICFTLYESSYIAYDLFARNFFPSFPIILNLCYCMHGGLHAACCEKGTSRLVSPVNIMAL